MEGREKGSEKYAEERRRKRRSGEMEVEKGERES